MFAREMTIQEEMEAYCRELEKFIKRSYPNDLPEKHWALNNLEHIKRLLNAKGK